jgi:hypothetical protein
MMSSTTADPSQPFIYRTGTEKPSERLLPSARTRQRAKATETRNKENSSVFIFFP